MAKEWLTEKGVEFEDFNVAENEDKAREMVEKTGQMGVPVLQVGDKFIVGFDKTELAASLDIKE
jgi:glutaredoxin